ncbi:MAG: ATP-binding protein, partial [Pseudonocardiales bacterium]|nr:ATP-binding protein [Pseudonocardiales bacterium]
LAAAVVAGRVDPTELDPPARLRSIAGSVVAAEDAVLLDRPWLAPVLAPDETVAAPLGNADDLDALAELLDLPLASELVDARVIGAGRPVRWTALAEVVSACAALRVEVPEGVLLLHDELTVELSRQTRTRPTRTRPTRTLVNVATWRDIDGHWHAADPVRALLALLAQPR